MRLDEYLNDGAKMQETCVMAYVRNQYENILNESYDKEMYDRYNGRIDVSRYYNCREQGYTLYLSYRWRPVVYVTFFEHRNSDNICLLINKGKMFSECPTASELWGERGKYDYDKSFKYMQIEECGEYITNLLKDELHNAIEEYTKKVAD